VYHYIVRRLLWILPVLFLISLITFVLMKLTPGGPFDATAGGRELPQQIVDAQKRRYHLDGPEWQQYLIYLGVWPTERDAQGRPVFKGVLQGDLGPSYQYRGRGVTEIIFGVPQGRPWWESRFWRTVTLGTFGFLIGAAVGIPLGIVAAVRHNSWADYLSLFFASVWYSTPSFILGIFLILIFALWLHWLPVVPQNWNTVRPWILPAVCLGAGLAAAVSRLTRAMMLEVLRQDYVRTARAKGLREEAVLLRHALRNALIPVTTVLGPALAGLITGSFFIETIFSFPGMGRLFVQAIGQRDYPVILGTTLLYAALIALANLVVDVVYGWLDPRISYA
jgi:oligopeptide transport system permease protein